MAQALHSWRPMMLRAHLAILVPTVALVLGCTVDVDQQGEGENPLAKEARDAFFDTVLPELVANCEVCHGASRAATYEIYGFFGTQDGDEYATIHNYNSDTNGLLNFDAPQDSRLLTKGAHDGPAWTQPQADIVRAWLDIEADFRSGGGTGPGEVETAAVNVADGANVIALDDAGATGATISFIKQNVGQSGWYLTNIELTSGPDGSIIKHPLFTIEDENGQRFPDIWDSYSETEHDIMTGISVQLGSSGVLMIPNVPPQARLLITFEIAEPACMVCGDGTVGPPPGGCQAVDEWIANVGPFVNQNCNGCHSAGNARNAMNLENLGQNLTDMDMEQLGRKCNEVLFRTNEDDISLSSVVVTTDPNGNVNHPFTFNGNAALHQTFIDNLQLWINAEIAASQ